MTKSISSLFLLFILFSGLVLVILPSVAFSQTENGDVEFTLELINNYTNETTTTTIPSYPAENNTIKVTIKNKGASYYNLRFKGQNESEWNYYPIDPTSGSGRHGYNLYDAYSNSVPYEASNSSYTVITLPSGYFQRFQVGDEVEVQIQALFGEFQSVIYGYSAPGGATYDFWFEGTINDWSGTQAVTFEENTLIPEFPSWTLLPILIVITSIVMLYKKQISKTTLLGTS